METREIRREWFGPATMFSALYQEAAYADVKIAAAGDNTLTIRAHRVVLAAASPFFAKKMKSYKADEGPLVLSYINFNMLKAIIDYLYHGKVVVRADEVEDFHSFRRMFEIELDPADREREGQGASQASNIRKRNLLLRGDGVSFKQGLFIVLLVFSICEPPAVSVQPFLLFPFQPVALKRERVGPSRPPAAAPHGPLPSSSATFVPQAPLKREAPAPPVIRTAVAADTALTRSPSFAVTFGGRPSASTSSSTKEIEDSPLFGDATSLAIPANVLSRAPNRSNFSGPHSRPVAGPRGYFWVEVVNQLDTTEHAIRDKYGDGLCHFLGRFGAYQSLYLAYPDAAKVEHVIRTVKAVEKYLPIKPVAELPGQLSPELANLRSNPVFNLSDSGVNTSATSIASERDAVDAASIRSRDYATKKYFLRIRNFPWQKVNLLRLLRNNGLEELRVEDIFGEPGTG